ncbi:helix-turn-helix transcriptional regulator [Marinomonas mediterranea]|jgi:Predicted transcriptional regulator|uniref:Helix-turn-helix type 11 domain-containing protein n=1 Tax=Marinomonas mediterranea (strain ATCC 700492 / JCM 21426 / NBRC 103028 / MMB-1) TaxID=717774 RepID=F2JU92_MARM1|nr:YafY family protein [Marinomonas mediterranea]ADZ91604.1 helix-turn-helix type 11 domain-containing protein [Marinomonas mediterranea MMB-1]WCN09563.1 HTH domain-containing protein [Marinomonas mediterranea]WCN13641.1 HTH domain-containing protein [Marinomonas mediterranea]WCN17704.1 HTH domain-containing protein [Marinomonas mediterranea MMB-1]
MSKSDRLFQLTNILRAHQPITARELSERLCVSERTIYRYIDDLSVSGVPVYGEAGVGYKLSEGFELPPLQLTEQELEALIVGVNMTFSWTGPMLSKASRSLLSKIEAALPHTVSTQSNNQRTVRTPGEHIRAIDSCHWDELHQLIQENQWAQICYRSLSGTETNRIIFPLGLFFWGGKWTIGSWCSSKNAYRDFRLDRIDTLEPASAPVKLPDSVNLNNYIEYQKNRSTHNTTDTTLSGV